MGQGIIKVIKVPLLLRTQEGNTETVRARWGVRASSEEETQRSWPSLSSSLRRKSISARVSAGLATTMRKKLPRVPWGW